MYRDLSGKASGYKKLKLAYVFLLEGGAVLVTHQKGTQFKFDAFLTLEHGMSVTDYDVSLLGKKERFVQIYICMCICVCVCVHLYII